jgi:HEAT repeat protein
LKTSEKELQSTVCLYVGKLHLKHPEVVGNALLPIVESSQSEIQEAAILSIAALRERRAIPSLVKIINSPIDPQSKTMWGLPIQITAIVALGEIRDSSAIPTLLELLDHEIYAERAIEALIKIGEPAAAKGLFERYIEPLNDKDHRLRGKIIEAVGKLGDEEMRAKLESHLAQCLPPQKGSIRAAIRNINERYPR